MFALCVLYGTRNCTLVYQFFFLLYKRVDHEQFYVCMYLYMCMYQQFINFFYFIASRV